jgi:hypothetical protein
MRFNRFEAAGLHLQTACCAQNDRLRQSAASVFAALDRQFGGDGRQDVGHFVAAYFVDWPNELD